MSAVNLAALPAITFAPLESGAIEAQIIAAYERIAKTTLYPGDPVRLFLESVAWFAIVENNLLDLAAKQNLLAYASGANLDHIGALMGVSRIPAQPARCVLRFSLARELGFTVAIPKGTRVSTRDGKAVFATVLSAEIQPGSLYADVPALCRETGTAGSGLLPGQIDSLIDPLPYISGAANIESSIDGVDMESDERLRERIRMAPESFTVAGSSGEYVARTLEVSSNIQSVAVVSPEPGVVDVRFVLDGGVLPDQAMCEMVEKALSAETVRPLTDQVIVRPPDEVFFSVSGTWWIAEEDAALLNGISQRIGDAFQEYLKWQQLKPGRDINPSRLAEMLMQTGAKRVEIDEPSFTRLTAVQIARVEGYGLDFGGVEDE